MRHSNINRISYRKLAVYSSYASLPAVFQLPFPTSHYLSYISYSSSAFHPQVIGRIPPASSSLPLAAWRSLSASLYRCTRREITIIITMLAFRQYRIFGLYWNGILSEGKQNNNIAWMLSPNRVSFRKSAVYLSYASLPAVGTRSFAWLHLKQQGRVNMTNYLVCVVLHPCFRGKQRRPFFLLYIVSSLFPILLPFPLYLILVVSRDYIYLRVKS